jgi:two-component system response regulator LytT
MRQRRDSGHDDAGTDHGMNDLRTFLVDDEQLARDELGFLLGQVQGVEVIGQAGNGVEALAAINRLAPDLVFLDVQMPGLNGFEVARRMLDADASAHIIFVTAYDQHAIEAFEVNAVDYLLKPVDPARLEVALQRARRRITLDRLSNDGISNDGLGLKRLTDSPGVNNDQLEQIIQLVTERRSRRERLALKVGERFMLVQSEDIIFASLIDDSISVVTSQHAGTSNYRTLDELQERLDPSVFWRVHRAHLVNINKIREIVPWFSRNYILKMKDEKATEIPVSRTQTRRLREYLKL